MSGQVAKEVPFRGHVCILSSNRLTDQRGGIETFVNTFACWLCVRGIPVTIIHRRISLLMPVGVSTPGKHLAAKASSTGVYPMPFIVSLIPMLFFSLLAALEVIAQHKAHRFALLHTQDSTFAGLSAIFAGRLLRIPVIVQIHAFPANIRDQRTGLNQAAELILTKIVFSFTTLVLVNSPVIQEYLISVGINRERLDTVALGVDTSKFRPNEYFREQFRQELAVDHSVILIGFVGAFRKEKNLGVLIQAFSSLQSYLDLPETRLVLAGSGHFENAARTLVSNLEIKDKVVFLGYRDDVNLILAGVDVIVIPSLFETFSLVLIEAMASGKAIVASDIPAIRERVRNGYSALLINPNDVVGLRDALILLTKDGIYRTKLGGNAWRDSQSYTNEAGFTKVVGIYYSLQTNQSGSQ